MTVYLEVISGNETWFAVMGSVGTVLIISRLLNIFF